MDRNSLIIGGVNSLDLFRFDKHGHFDTWLGIAAGNVYVFHFAGCLGTERLLNSAQIVRFKF